MPVCYFQSMLDVNLWERIDSFCLDTAETMFPFSRRLAYDNGWSERYAEKVCEEYKKFMYLAVVAGPVTPSEDIDQAWHLHLCYTRSYWDDFCGQVLRKKIHHNPTKGGTAERGKFKNWHVNTKKAYMEEFGEEPPMSVWAKNGLKFENMKYREVEMSKYFVLHKKTVFGLSSITALTFALTGCSKGEVIGTIYIVGVPIVIFIILLVFCFKGGSKGGSDCGSACGSGCGG